MLTEQGWLLESRAGASAQRGRCAREVSMARKAKTGTAPEGASWSKPVAGILTAGLALLSFLALGSALIAGRPRLSFARAGFLNVSSLSEIYPVALHVALRELGFRQFRV